MWHNAGALRVDLRAPALGRFGDLAQRPAGFGRERGFEGLRQQRIGAGLQFYVGALSIA